MTGLGALAVLALANSHPRHLPNSGYWPDVYLSADRRRKANCPKDRRQAEGLVQLHREMEVGYCRLVTISTDNLLETNENRSAVGAHWPFLSDPGRKVQKDLDIAEVAKRTGGVLRS